MPGPDGDPVEIGDDPGLRKEIGCFREYLVGLVTPGDVGEQQFTGPGVARQPASRGGRQMPSCPRERRDCTYSRSGRWISTAAGSPAAVDPFIDAVCACNPRNDDGQPHDGSRVQAALRPGGHPHTNFAQLGRSAAVVKR